MFNSEVRTRFVLTKHVMKFIIPGVISCHILGLLTMVILRT